QDTPHLAEDRYHRGQILVRRRLEAELSGYVVIPQAVIRRRGHHTLHAVGWQLRENVPAIPHPHRHHTSIPAIAPITGELSKSPLPPSLVVIRPCSASVSIRASALSGLGCPL